MTQTKTYAATIQITFETLEGENPRSIAKDMANIHNGTRGANLYVYGELEKVKVFRSPDEKQYTSR